MGKINGFCLGCWDGMHEGHIELLRRASLLVDNLYVLVVDDETIKTEKGNDRPIFNLKHRLNLVSLLPYTFKALQINSFDPYNLISDMIDNQGYKFAYFIKGSDQFHVPSARLERDFKIDIKTLSRTPNVSTTDITKKLTKGKQ